MGDFPDFDAQKHKHPIIFSVRGQLQDAGGHMDENTFVGWTSFQQTDRGGWVFAQSVSEHTPSGSGTDNDVIIICCLDY